MLEIINICTIWKFWQRTKRICINPAEIWNSKEIRLSNSKKKLASSKIKIICKIEVTDLLLWKRIKSRRYVKNESIIAQNIVEMITQYVNSSNCITRETTYSRKCRISRGARRNNTIRSSQHQRKCREATCWRKT